MNERMEVCIRPWPTGHSAERERERAVVHHNNQ